MVWGLYQIQKIMCEMAKKHEWVEIDCSSRGKAVLQGGRHQDIWPGRVQTKRAPEGIRRPK